MVSLIQKLMKLYSLATPQEVVNFDEFTKVHYVEPIKRPEEYKSFIYFYEVMPTKEEVSNQVGNQQQVSITIESQQVKRNRLRN